MSSTNSFVTVPEHEHTGPTDGSDCKLCQFYQRGYWSATDMMLDYSRRNYRDGQLLGRSSVEHEYREFALFLLRCFIYGAAIGILIRAVADSKRAKTAAADV